MDTNEVALWQHANLYSSGAAGKKFNVALKDVNYKGLCLALACLCGCCTTKVRLPLR
jgi:hypothetical protein